MSNHAYIKLVEASSQQTITLAELKDIFTYYKGITTKTGDQLSWNYSEAAFPYEIVDLPEEDGEWFYLKNKDQPRYNYIVFGIGNEEINTDDGETKSQTYIEIILPEGATHGDKAKANEFCKFLGNKLKGEVHLFNNRIMYYYKRK
ncbi:DUF1885 family protein [Desertibacillus haloalkaliphilus]|uniref:DUF1885 family protein n=1 Tax=Desertibacillus haloalkaliphilus TaxID=1328930 RepID=UPI001C27E61B|nr:DUF1885 family protein [Desertibacillus haloalkaliphilus]MBU8906746.1 DUF1885 family protein [Desertibacillus haloalkaliphilus]